MWGVWAWIGAWVAASLLILYFSRNVIEIVGGGFLASVVLFLGGGLAYQAVVETDAEKQQAKNEASECRQDLRCWAKEHEYEAERACRPEIERLARIDVRWDDEFLMQEFSKLKWADKAAGTVMYFGDRVQFQNGLGAWVRHRYSCTYDPATETVQRARAEPGRIPSS